MPFKTGSLLSLLVLALHLALLQQFPKPPTLTLAPDSYRFFTRSLTADDSAALSPPSDARLTRRKPAAPATAPATAPPAPDAQPPDEAPNAPAQSAALSAAAQAASSEPAQDAQSAPNDPLIAESETPARPPREPSFTLGVVKLPDSTRLNYQVLSNKFPYRLSGELLWQNQGRDYQARLSYRAFGQSRVQTSQGQIGAQGLEPKRFSDKVRSEVAAHFNRSLGKITFSANTPDAPLLAGAQDRLSVLIQLAAMAASEPARFLNSTTLSIQTVGARSADLWLFTVGDMEELSLPGGALKGLKLLRNPREAYDQKVEIWLAPSLHYLPARIRISESNGDYIDQQWSDSQALDPA